MKSVYYFAMDIANWRNQAKQKGGPQNHPTRFHPYSDTRESPVCPGQCLPEVHMHATPPEQQRLVASRSRHHTRECLVSCISATRFEHFYKGYRMPVLGAGAYISRHIQQLFTQYERNMTQAVPPTAQQT